MASARPGADYNTRILRPLAMYVAEKFGTNTLTEVAAAGGVADEILDGRSYWVSISQFEAILIAARKLMSSDDEYKLACAYRIAEAYGAIRYVLRSMSPIMVFRQSLKTYHLVSNVGEHEIVDSSPTHIIVKWRATPAPHRLVCVCKQAQTAAFPTLWGLPPAKMTESKCLARGDECCEYEARWFVNVPWVPTALGAMVGGGIALVLNRYPGIPLLAAMCLPFILGLTSHVLSLYRTMQRNRSVERSMMDALESVAAQESAARVELLELHESQRDWTRLLEEENRDRAQAIEGVTDHFKALEVNRSEVVRGYSHDLRNPLQVMSLGAGYLRNLVGRSDPQAIKVIEELEWSVQQMNQLLTQLNRIAAQPSGTSLLNPQKLAVENLTNKVRRRLKALAYGKDLTTTVFATREAPVSIDLDPLLFDRLVDNLLTNAIKYTNRGSIVVEVDGAPGFLVLKVSDTGRGIAPEDLERSFSPGGSDEASRATNSLGVGLSVVVQLLGEIGGRLEIMSKPSLGTTFWLHLPIEAKKADTKPEQETAAAVMRKVVSIRKIG